MFKETLLNIPNMTPSYFYIQKEKGQIIINDIQDFEERVQSTVWCILKANEIYNFPDFPKTIIYTCDYETNSYDFSFCKNNSFFNLIPDFNFHCSREDGIEDYEEMTTKIDLAGQGPAIYKKIGWIGQLTHENRRKLANIAENNPTLIDCFPINCLLDTTQDNHHASNMDVSLPELTERYSFLLDIEGNGYSGRLKYLLWSHRPLLFVDRPHKEFFFKYWKEWEHYIPVKRDLSDLIEKAIWCMNNYDKALLIADNAFRFSQKYLTREYCFFLWNQIFISKYANNSFNSHYIEMLHEEKPIYTLNKTIWLLWLQGWHQAPWLALQVALSWEIHNPDWKIQYVSLENIRDFVFDIDYIFDQTKHISNPAKSDIIRLSLLKNHGGVWADSTLLCMQPLDHWIFNALRPSNFWMYHGTGAYMNPLHGPASWFIASHKNSYIISQWKKLCDNFWINNLHTSTYNWLDCIFHFLFDNDTFFRSSWNNVPYLNCEDFAQSHMLAPHHFGTFSNSSICKQLILLRPPYMIKLLSDWNTHYKDISTPECQDSNGFFAIQMSKRHFVYKHNMTSST